MHWKLSLFGQLVPVLILQTPETRFMLMFSLEEIALRGAGQLN